MASNPKQEREARARLRAYQARQSVHERRISRRARDNWIAAIALVIILVLAVGAQIFFFSGGPGTPAPTPSASATPSATATPDAGQNIGDVPPAELAEGRTWTGTLTLNDVALGVELDGAAAPRISGDLEALRTARIASGGAGSPTTIATGSPALLGIGCGSDRVFLNFSGAPVQVDGLAGWQDRLSEQPCGHTLAVEPWGVIWAGPGA